MFINLVRIQLFKLSHSRFIRWGAVVYILATAAFFFSMLNVANSEIMVNHELFVDSTDNERRALFAVVYLNVALYCGNIIATGGVINLLTNHYEHREKINVSGVVRSPSLWYLSETVALMVFACILGVYAISTTGVLMYLMGITDVNYMTPSTLIMFLGATVSIFFIMEPAIPICKFFRKLNTSLVVSIAFIVFRLLFGIFIAGFFIGAAGGDVAEVKEVTNISNSIEVAAEVSSQLPAFIINPGNALINLGSGSNLGFSWIIFILVIVVRLAFYPLLGFFASLRKNEL